MADKAVEVAVAEAFSLYGQGLGQQAEERLRAVLEAEPENPRARVLLGVICTKQHRYDEAILLFETILHEIPDQFDSLVWMSKIMLDRRRFDEALAFAQKAVDAAPNDPAGHNAVGLCMLSMRMSNDAVAAFHRAIQANPRLPASHFNLGLALRLQDHAFEACDAFRKAVELGPNQERNYLELFSQQHVISAWNDAIQNLKEGHKRLPYSVAIAEALGYAYTRLNDKERAEKLFKRVWAIEPGVCRSYAIWLQEEGRFDDSITLLKQSLEVEPAQGAAYYCLAEAKAFELDGVSWIDRAKELFDHPKVNDLGRMYLSYALGKAYDSAKEYRLAIEQFDRANDLAYGIFNSGRRLDAEVLSNNTEQLGVMYSKETVEELQRFGSDDTAPVFIVGMIRSGTTLLDQIVSSHPDVVAAGELPFWKLDGAQLTIKWNLQGIDENDLRPLAENYLWVLDRMVGQAPRITDKMPLNYEMLGLIHAAFPKAKILHIRRNPVDTCLSIYMTHFGGGPNFAYKQENIVCYYREYLRLMELWRTVLPATSLYELDYEDLIGRKEEVTREIIDFLGLPWDDACLHHEQNPSAVSTPSRWQARQPVYKTSVERWRRYEPWLGVLLELKDVAHPTIDNRKL